jgi:hypothetical protein
MLFLNAAVARSSFGWRTSSFVVMGASLVA